MRIGELADRTESTTKTIRYYESRAGFCPPRPELQPAIGRIPTTRCGDFS